MKKKKAQAWGFDLLVASFLFFFSIIFFYFFTINNPQTEDTFRNLQEEGDFIAESLLSDGFPKDWNEDNVRVIGLLSEGEINATKVASFSNLASNNYALTRSLFRISSNYYVNFSQEIGGISGIGLLPSNSKNIVATTRIAPYNGTLIKIRIDVWN